jgi:hypothetical protein
MFTGPIQQQQPTEGDDTMPEGQPRSTGRPAGTIEGQETLASGPITRNVPTQPAGESSAVTQAGIPTVARTARLATKLTPGSPNRSGAFSRQTGEVQR